jgi:hypothetical protein
MYVCIYSALLSQLCIEHGTEVYREGRREGGRGEVE